MKILKTLAIALPLVGGGVAFAPSEAAAHHNSGASCTAVAFRANGNAIRGTRAEVDARNADRACRRALRRCERRLDRVRYERDRPMRRARCEVVDIDRRHDDRFDRRWGHNNGFRFGYDRDGDFRLILRFD